MFPLKLVFEDDIRKTSLETFTVAALYERVKSLFPDVANVPFDNMFLFYIDNEMDKIRIRSDSDLLEAHNSILTGTLLKIYVQGSVPNVMPPSLGASFGFNPGNPMQSVLNSLAMSGIMNPATLQQMSTALPTLLSSLMLANPVPPLSADPTPITSTTSTATGDDEDDKDYEVERIIDRKPVGQGRYIYLIKWKGYGDEDCTWEPEEALSCSDLVVEYLATLNENSSTQTYEGVTQTTQTQQNSSATQTTQTQSNPNQTTQTTSGASATQTTQTNVPSATQTTQTNVPSATQTTQTQVMSSTQTTQTNAPNTSQTTQTASTPNGYEFLKGTEFGKLLGQLAELGFSDKETCVQALVKHGGNLPAAVNELLDL